MTHPEFTAVVHSSVATSKELAAQLQEKVTENKTGNIELDATYVHAIASQLRITANLVAGLLEENASMLDRINSLVDRLNKD